MTYVLFLWFEPDSRPLKQAKFGAWMPECPAVGTTVHVPLDPPDYRGDTDPENTLALEVQRVVWSCDGTPHWHAEVQLR